MKNPLLPRKDAIILTAIEIIDELGLQALSTKELAARQDIAESALYRHFKSKDAIIVAMLEYFAKFDRAIINSARKMDVSAKERIIYCVNGFVEYYENFPAITALLFFYEMLRRYNKQIQEQVEGIFQDRFAAIVEFVAAGQKQDELSTAYTPDEYADIILGASRETILRWRIGGYSFALKDKVLSVLTRWLTAVEVSKSAEPIRREKV